MLHVCDIFAVDYDLKFNTHAKSAAMGVGSCFNVDCASLMLTEQNLTYVATVNYLVAAKCFKCTMDHIRMKF